MHLSTGVLGLDILMGGGWKRGTINEIWGESGTGKTTLALTSVQARGEHERTATWITTRGPLDFTPGVTDNLVVAEPRTAEQVFDVAMSASGIGASYIVIDDANHLVRGIELTDPNYVPDEHREFKNELKMLKGVVKNSGAIVLFLSQPRNNQRAPIRGTGISEKAYDRISLVAVQQHQDKTVRVQSHVKRVDKYCQFMVQPGKGINRERQLWYWGVKSGFVQSNGTWWYSFRDADGMQWINVQGTDQFEQYMRQHPDEADLLEYQMRQHYAIDTAYVLDVR